MTRPKRKRKFPWHEKDFKSTNLMDVSICVAPISFLIIEILALLFMICMGLYLWWDTWGTEDALWGYLGALACFGFAGGFLYHFYLVVFKGKDLKYSFIDHADEAIILIIIVILATVVISIPIWFYNLICYKNVK